MTVHQYLGTNIGGQATDGLNLSTNGSVPDYDENLRDENLRDDTSQSEDLPAFSDDDNGSVEV